MASLAVPPDHALVVYTRVEKSSLKTTTRKSRGRRCSIRSYSMRPIPLPGVAIAENERAYAYAEGDLSHTLSKVARHGHFTAVIARPTSNRPVIVDIINFDDAVSYARRARHLHEDAEWEALAPKIG